MKFKVGDKVKLIPLKKALKELNIVFGIGESDYEKEQEMGIRVINKISNKGMGWVKLKNSAYKFPVILLEKAKDGK